MHHLKSSKGNICAKITDNQLITPLLDLEIGIQRQYKLPYSKVVADLLLAASITSTQYVKAQESIKVEQHAISQNYSVNKSIISNTEREIIKGKKVKKIVSFKDSILSKGNK